MDKYARVFIKDFTLSMAIGLHAWERGDNNKQKVKVSVELFTDPVSYLTGIQSENIIDYDRIVERLQEWQTRPHVDLIETCAAELLDLAFGFKSVTAARVRVEKPDIFPAAAAAGVEVYMTRADYECLSAQL